MALYLDPSKNAYVDPETGAIIPLAVVLGEDDSNSGNYRQTPNPSYSSGTYVSVPTAYASPYITNHRDSTSAPSPPSPTSAGILSLLLFIIIIIHCYYYYYSLLLL